MIYDANSQRVGSTRGSQFHVMANEVVKKVKAAKMTASICIDYEARGDSISNRFRCWWLMVIDIAHTGHSDRDFTLVFILIRARIHINKMSSRWLNVPLTRTFGPRLHQIYSQGFTWW